MIKLNKQPDPDSIISMYVINLRIYIFTTIGQQLLEKKNAKENISKNDNKQTNKRTIAK